jgi:hypothetical protein
MTGEILPASIVIRCERAWLRGLPNNTVIIDGETFSMRQHGFAWNKQFSIVGIVGARI